MANSPDCTVWEDVHNSENLSFATLLINGRYPERLKSSSEAQKEKFISYLKNLPEVFYVIRVLAIVI